MEPKLDLLTQFAWGQLGNSINVFLAINSVNADHVTQEKRTAFGVQLQMED